MAGRLYPTLDATEIRRTASVFVFRPESSCRQVVDGILAQKELVLFLSWLNWAGRVTVDLVDGIRFPTAVLLFPNEWSCEPNSALRVLPLASARCPPPPPFPIKIAFLY